MKVKMCQSGNPVITSTHPPPIRVHIHLQNSILLIIERGIFKKEVYEKKIFFFNFKKPSPHQNSISHPSCYYQAFPLPAAPPKPPPFQLLPPLLLLLFTCPMPLLPGAFAFNCKLFIANKKYEKKIKITKKRTIYHFAFTKTLLPTLALSITKAVTIIRH